LNSITSEELFRKNTKNAFADYFRFRVLPVKNALQKITLSALSAKKPGFRQAFS